MVYERNGNNIDLTEREIGELYLVNQSKNAKHPKKLQQPTKSQPVKVVPGETYWDPVKIANKPTQSTVPRPQIIREADNSFQNMEFKEVIALVPFFHFFFF